MHTHTHTCIHTHAYRHTHTHTRVYRHADSVYTCDLCGKRKPVCVCVCVCLQKPSEGGFAAELAQMDANERLRALSAMPPQSAKPKTSEMDINKKPKKSALKVGCVGVRNTHAHAYTHRTCQQKTEKERCQGTQSCCIRVTACRRTQST